MIPAEQVERIGPGDVVYIDSRRMVFIRNTATGYMAFADGHGGNWMYKAHHLQQFGTRYVPKHRTRKVSNRRSSKLDVCKTDGGRAAAHPSENNDCTVRALALYKDWSYSKAHTFMHLNGRKPGKGCNVGRFYPLAGLHDVCSYTTGLRKCRTLGQLLACSELPARCIVQVRRHVACIIDGKVHDTFAMGKSRRVFGVWV